MQLLFTLSSFSIPITERSSSSSPNPTSITNMPLQSTARNDSIAHVNAAAAPATAEVANIALPSSPAIAPTRLSAQQAAERCTRPRQQLGYHYNPSLSYDYANIRTMTDTCSFCRARKWRKETASMCCASGKVVLPNLTPPPQPLYEYLTSASPLFLQFQQNIRKYNSCFQMTSFGADRRIVDPGFMPTFKIQGHVYHRIGSVLPNEGEEPSFLQIYFMEDYNKQAQRRIECQGRQTDLHFQTVYNIQQMLLNCNPYISLFKTALEQNTSGDRKILIRADKTPVGQHSRRYNAPSASEVAALIVEGTEAQNRDVLLSPETTVPCSELMRRTVAMTPGSILYSFLKVKTDTT